MNGSWDFLLFHFFFCHISPFICHSLLYLYFVTGLLSFLSLTCTYSFICDACSLSSYDIFFLDIIPPICLLHPPFLPSPQHLLALSFISSFFYSVSLHLSFAHFFTLLRPCSFFSICLPPPHSFSSAIMRKRCWGTPRPLSFCLHPLLPLFLLLANSSFSVLLFCFYFETPTENVATNYVCEINS